MLADLDTRQPWPGDFTTVKLFKVLYDTNFSIGLAVFTIQCEKDLVGAHEGD